ncbi:hypothetical protein UFOVP669_49 [uncultured Caudovirales phage]|uniref:Uncharacterized protein n=1 Tax=uncultured Caudovirales phage TaxID=2100421 RepID=A0A6J5MA52_9CAUD|nr:hypothetical protein UFOVP400_40 [uncultured Caudovirales phage]CAB4156205.1 hypothetical protein UFOVP669_49 [uncultured Caudovirales phage]CAB4213445.1 hypothetical protein UFOVP1449_23 [uncultured Caudovirales phage]
MQTIRTNYSRHVLRATRAGFQPLTLRQFVAMAAAINFEGI